MYQSNFASSAVSYQLSAVMVTVLEFAKERFGGRYIHVIKPFQKGSTQVACLYIV